MPNAARACAPGAAPLLLRYQTPPSGGKTSATALLGACLQLQTQRHVIYACYSRQVRIDVCKHLLAAAVPFAIVVQGVASPHNSCYHQRPRADVPPAEPEKRVEWSLSACRRCDRFPVALICDLASSVLLLRHGEQHVLLFDEPTADVAPGMQADVRRLLRCAPAVTVLMSAGVPPFEAMPAFVAHFCARHAGAELRTVASARLPMSVTALDAAERVWAPHQLGVPVDVIEADGHLLRFYSPRVLAQLAPAGGVAFADLLSYAAVRAACLRLLRAAPPAAAPPAPAEPLELQHFCTRHAWRLPGASLVILDAVADFLRTALTPNVADLPTLRRLLKHEERHLKAEARQGGRADLPRSKSEGPPPAPAAEAPPELWPAACVLNTLEHLQRHAPQAAKSFPTKWLRAALPLPTAVRDTSHETVVEAALCGVLPFGGLGDALFEATAQTLAEQARESLAVADAQLIYGLNFPVERVVVGCQPLSYLEMKQLCGRAGRTGRLAKAEVVFLAEATLRAAMVPPADAAQLAEAAVNFAL